MSSNSNPTSWFLLLPSPVQLQILKHVISGNEGLKHLLSLRLVCKTTKSWIDDLPKAQASRLFFKAQVVLGYFHTSAYDIFDEFLKYPPTFGIASLSLRKYVLEIKKGIDFPKTEENFKLFCSFWVHRLEHFEMNLKYPNYRFDTQDMLQLLYSELLEKSQNLKSLKIPVFNETHRKCLNSFLQLKKNNNNLRLEVVFNSRTHYNDPNINFESETDRQSLESTAMLILDSKAEIQLEVKDSSILPKMKTILTEKDFLKFLRLIVELDSLHLTVELLRLNELLPKTKSITIECEVNRNLEQLTFPPALETLTLQDGFPVIHHLPETLTSLTINEFKFTPTALLTSMSILDDRCPNLSTLFLYGNLEDTFGIENYTPRRHEVSAFTRLRTVAIGMDFPTYPVGVSKASFVFLNILPWVSLNLDHLALSSFASSVSIGGPVTFDVLAKLYSVRTRKTKKLVPRSRLFRDIDEDPSFELLDQYLARGATYFSEKLNLLLLEEAQTTKRTKTKTTTKTKTRNRTTGIRSKCRMFLHSCID